MARKTGKAPAVLIDEEQETTAPEPESTDTEPPQSRKSISKAGAAREALAEGYTVPREAIIHIKKKHGIDMSPQQFSAEKCRLKARSGDPDFHFLRDQGASPELMNKAPRNGAFGEPDLLESLEVMKPLIDRLGADKVKRMVDLLG